MSWLIIGFRDFYLAIMGTVQQGALNCALSQLLVEIVL